MGRTRLQDGPVFTTSAPAATEEGIVVRGAGAFALSGGGIPGLLESETQQAIETLALVIYQGYAALGVAAATAGWTIKRVTLDGSGNPTAIQWSAVNQIWNNRATTVTYS